jgi:long-chain acyl-CoA synthetase
VARVNESLAPHERIVRWAAVAEDLTESDGALTPTLKVRRAVVESRYHARVEALFA